ncbi:MAG: GNAT family N-acetyltransferase [Coriobacteriales bacterium]|nr:GNAT family N-acetyltransferase [Coriobacteriales bacterium]
MTLRIRTATLDDLDIVTELEQAAFLPAEAASRERMEQRLLYFPNHFHLMFNGDALVSYISAMPSDERDLRDEMYADARLQDELGSWEMIFSVATLPSYQDLGIASQLMRSYLESTREQGRKGIVLTCKEKLVGFYARFGFVDEGMSDSSHGGATWYQMRLVF